MEALRETHGVDSVLWALRILAIRCRSRPETRTIAEEMAATRASLRDVKDAWELARDERMAATGEIAYCDAVLDASVMTLARQASALVNGRTDDPRYRTLFPSAPSEALRPTGGDAQTAYVKGVLHALDADDALEPLRAFKKPIVKALGDLQKATARRDELQVVEGAAATALSLATSSARDAHNHAWHRISVVFPHNKPLVESFFRQGAPARARDAGSDAEAPAPPASGEHPAAPAVEVPRRAAASSRRRR